MTGFIAVDMLSEISKALEYEKRLDSTEGRRAGMPTARPV